MRRRTLMAGGLGLALLTACESEGAGATGTLRIATGSQAAVYYAYGTAIKKLAARYLPNVEVSVIETNASGENVFDVLIGQAEVGFTQADVAAEGEHNAPGQLRTLARLYDDYVHLVVPAGGPIRTVADLTGRRVSIGPERSGTATTANRILDVAGIRAAVHQQQLNLPLSATALQKGEIDAFFFSGGLPLKGVSDLAEAFAIRLVALDKQVPGLRQRHGDYYSERVVPASTYKGISATVAIGIANYLVVREAMPDPLAYGVTRLLFEGRDELAKAHQAAGRLNIRSAISTPPLPLHPGAIRYYRAQKA